jgi:hypothetical protein
MFRSSFREKGAQVSIIPWLLNNLLITDSATPGDEHLSEDIEQLFELTKIMVLVLTGLVPNLDESKKGGTTNARDADEIRMLKTIASAP